jgi:4-hydroxythreonine-4-phosphate dehydrogenase
LKPTVGISVGDPSGIGPEVTAAALKHPKVRAALTAKVFGDASMAKLFPKGTLVAVSTLGERDRLPGRPTHAGGLAQLAYVDAAIASAQAGQVRALCTAPVSKETISRAGVPFMGHTERLAEAFGVEVLMLMDGPRLKVALATNHVPIAALPSLLKVTTLLAQLKLLQRSLKRVVRRNPVIAVCGLNPHAGEGGLLGTEEEIIAKAVQIARRQGVNVSGPHPADGIIPKVARGLDVDVVLAMFHDQALVAAKALDFEATVNVTLGLPVPRTSPDHGVAYDIAGRGKANAAPMVHALIKAATLAR